MLRYAITDGTFGTAPEQWLARIRRLLGKGIEMIQIREGEMPARDLVDVVRQVMRFPNPGASKILVNDRADIAVIAGAHGVHLKDHSIAPERLRTILPPGFLIGVSCHDLAGIRAARMADFLVAAPVFPPLSKPEGRAALGLRGLRALIESAVPPVLALGGITEETAPLCIREGAAGVAGISLFRP